MSIRREKAVVLEVSEMTCNRGHPWEIYAYVKPDGHRFCKECSYIAKKAAWQRRMTEPDRALEPLDRFNKRLDKSPGHGPKGDCWIWTGGKSAFGYGELSVEGKLMRTHRYAWEIEHGPILDGLQVLHKCDNPPCCRTSHLFLGYDADNVADKIAKGRGPDMKFVSTYRRNPRGEINGMAKLTWDSVRAIRKEYSPEVTSYSKLATKYGTTTGNISNIVNNKAWREV